MKAITRNVIRKPELLFHSIDGILHHHYISHRTSTAEYMSPPVFAVIEWRLRISKRNVGPLPIRWLDDMVKTASSRWMQASSNVNDNNKIVAN